MTKRFLLADDDADDRELFREAISEVDPSIICYCAGNGAEVLEKLNSKEFLEPGIIFLDINMPAMNGWQCLTKLKETPAYLHIPVIMYSTSSHQREVDIALEMGALCFFTKPSDFNQLKIILEVIAANLNGNILQAISKYESIKAKKNIRVKEL